MAIRSGAGTGVIVSLVVFIVVTVCLLVLTIVFYAGKAEATEGLAAAEGNLDTYARPTERSSDQFKNLESSAAAARASVAGYLNQEYQSLMRFVAGDASTSREELAAAMQTYGLAEGEVVKTLVERQRRDLRRRETEIESLNGKLADRDATIAEREAQLAQQKDDHQRAIDQITAGVRGYESASTEHQRAIQSAIAELEDAKERLRDSYEDRILGLEDELDEVNRESVLLRARLDEYQRILDEIRVKGTSPELLVDARVINVDPAQDLVFMDRGRADRIVLGMTFEVYDDEASIRVNPRSGALPRGKASLQVTKVSESSSTCKIIRGVPGRPVVRGDVLANAVYDPSYRFKFLVHGKFDVDGDGRPTEAEAEYLRSLIVEWGGEIVLGDELPGDLDFLILGAEPPMPANPPLDATEHQTRIWIEKREANLKYNELFRQSSEAQIPVLNANRFFILIGRAGDN